MNYKKILIAGFAGLMCCTLTAEEESSFKIADDFFVYTVGRKGTNALECINKDATIYDLNNFIYAECWNRNVKPRLDAGAKLSKDDAELIRFCLHAKIAMVESLAYVILRDMLSSSVFDGFIADALAKSEENGGDSIVGRHVAQELMEKFASSDSGIRVPIKKWTNTYSPVPSKVMVRVLENVVHATGGVGEGAEGVTDETGGFIEYARVGLKLLSENDRLEGIFEANKKLFGETKPKEIMSGAMMITNRGKDICGRWTSAHGRINRFPSELLVMMNALRKHLNNENLDSGSMRLVDEILSEVEARSEYAVRMCDYVVYDLPFCILSYRALGRLKECKGYVTDDEVKMRAVAADYADAICGTEMLKGIRTRHAASCYTEVVKFLKGELGWFTHGAFKDFVNEVKLYNIILKTDETGKQDNVLETCK